MFLQAFLGCLLALITWGVMKWTIAGFLSWRVRRAMGTSDVSPLAGIDFHAMREQHKREVDEQNERERKLLAAEIVRQINAQRT